MKALIIIILAVMLGGCSLFQRSINVDVVPEKLPFIHPAPPNRMFIKEIRFTVMNEELLRELLDSIEPGEKIALFILTAQGYQSLAENTAETLRYIKDQQVVIRYYREATTEKETDDETE